MPIGKNAIKRISNNGYSAVNSSAPDMENSEIIAKEPVKEEKKPQPKKTTAKKPTAPKSAPKAQPKAEPKAQAKPEPKKATEPKAQAKPEPKKSMEKEPELSPVKVAKKVVKKPASAKKTETNGCVHIGEELPIYLL